jgi:glycosyltransferase involved in cell wall biosynthesis
MPSPLVTVVIPAFNASKTIERAVDSVLVQGFHDYEIVVIDDKSTDDTAEVVQRRYGEQVRLLRLPQNVGESGAMNAGITDARGEFIAFLDADDEWLPDKLEPQVAVLKRNPRAALVACGCRFVDPSGETVRDAGIFSVNVARSEIWRVLLARTLLAKPCVVARADALRAVGPFDTGLAVGADQDMWIRLALHGEIELVPAILVLVHDTAGSLTKAYADRVDRYMLPMIRRHIDAQRHRLPREEIRAILGERYATIGRNLYQAGRLVRGAELLLRSALMRHNIGGNLWYLITASPPAKVIKRLAAA